MSTKLNALCLNLRENKMEFEEFLKTLLRNIKLFYFINIIFINIYLLFFYNYSQ